MTQIFLTGASGYIGGQVLHVLAKAHPDYIIRTLVRDASKGKTIASQYPNVQIVEGDLDNAAVLTKEVGGADIVLHLAATGHLKSVETIHNAFKSRPADAKPAHWIQVSGASAVAAGELADKARVPGSPSDKIYDDLDGVAEVREVIQKHPSRAVDNYILKVATETPQVNTALVFPPIIYGPGEGPINQRSIQIPTLAKVTLQRKRGLQVGKGQSRWTDIHIHDLGDVFLRLVDRAVQGGHDNLWNLDGLYLVGDGEKTFGEISRLVARTALQKGLIPNDDVDEIVGDEANTLLPHGNVLFGTNARSVPRRSKELLGWTPQYPNGLDAEIPRAVEEEARAVPKLA